jgi:hypothetical protein
MEPLKTAKDTISVVGEVLKVAASNPDTREAGGELGKAALTITKTINNALLPLAAINYAFDKARAYFEDRFPQDIAERVAQVPNEHIVEPKASIAGPAIQGLAFAHEEPDLKKMYLHLLGTAMDGRKAASAHPAFVEIIRQLNAEEARLLGVVLPARDGLEIVELRLNVDKAGGWQTLQRHLIPFRNPTTGAPVVFSRQAAIVDNWIRLGLVTVEYGKFLVGEDRYKWVESRPEYERFASERQEGKLTYEKGVIAPTALGLQFASVVGVGAAP